MNAYLAENIAGVRVIQSFVREPQNVARFDEINDHNLDANLRAAKLSSLLFPVVTFVEALATALVLYFGGRMVLGSECLHGRRAVHVRGPYRPLLRSDQHAFAVLQHDAGRDGGRRAHLRLLDVDDEIEDKPDARELPRVRGHVEFDDVRFGYDDVEILHGVSLDVAPGQTIAFVGETGAGKTSMINLLASFYDVCAGAIRIDGYDLRDVTQRSLRSQLGVVLQDTFLFAGTIRQNICFARPDATDCGDDRRRESGRRARLYHGAARRI